MTENQVIGRFAPTPSGPLHFGSLVTAIASYCHARSQSGKWLLRIEDVDKPRIVKGSTSQILHDLELSGFEWDDAVTFQSDNFDRYEAVLQTLYARGQCYACDCSRKSLRQALALSGPLGLIYPGKCRSRQLTQASHSIRVNTQNAGTCRYLDQVYGDVSFFISEQVGDFVLKRADGIFAYHLAVVLDDEYQGINQVVRGADLLEAACLHLYLQKLLGYKTPEYLHVPLVRNENGDKLSKQTGATAIDRKRLPQQMVSALQFLNQPGIQQLRHSTPHEILEQAIKTWDHRLIAKPQGDIY